MSDLEQLLLAYAIMFEGGFVFTLVCTKGDGYGWRKALLYAVLGGLFLPFVPFLGWVCIGMGWLMPIALPLIFLGEMMDVL